MIESTKQKVLIVCTGNSCRSQMAEGLWNEIGRGKWEAYSAGSNPAGYVHPLAIEVMKEAGIDIAQNQSKHLDEYKSMLFDLVITVCDHAQQSCPYFANTREILHWPFPDPAHQTGTPEEVLDFFRSVRDQIANKISDYLVQREGV